MENRIAAQKTDRLAVMVFYRHTGPQPGLLQKSEVTRKDTYSFLGLLTKAVRRAVHSDEMSE